MSVFTIKGLCCGTLICNDYRYPELYRAYKRHGVQLMFHSYHAAHMSPERFRRMEATVGNAYHAYSRGTTYPGITMPAMMIAAAASNHLWISCPNSSADLYDSTRAWRDRALAGILHSGSLVYDERSEQRTEV